MPFLAAVVILFVILLFSAFNVLNEYERAVVFTLGRFTGIKGPGLVLIWPVIQRMRRVDLRVIVLNVPKQDVITRDNVSVKINAVVTSCLGTLSTMTRRSTRRILWMTGQ